MAERTPGKAPEKKSRYSIAKTLELFVTEVYEPGRPLPTTSQYADDIFHATEKTVHEAMGILAEKKLVDRRPRRGTIVSRRYTPGELPSRDEEGVHYVREMSWRNEVSELSESNRSLVPDIMEQMQAEDFSTEDIERVVVTAFSLLSSGRRVPISMVGAAVGSIIADARVLRDREVKGDVLAKAIRHPVDFYLSEEQEKERQRVEQDRVRKASPFMSTGEIIAQLRKDAGLSQGALAEQVPGINQMAISRAELGRRKLTQDETTAIKDALQAVHHISDDDPRIQNLLHGTPRFLRILPITAADQQSAADNTTRARRPIKASTAVKPRPRSRPLVTQKDAEPVRLPAKKIVPKAATGERDHDNTAQELTHRGKEVRVSVFDSRADALAELERPPFSLITMAKLSAAVGNSEAKAALYTRMGNRIDYNSLGLYHLIRDAWSDIGKKNPASWCLDSFVPLLVSISHGNHDEILYRKTVGEWGWEYLAEAWAGHSLKFSETHPATALSLLQAERFADKSEVIGIPSGTLLRINLLRELAKVDGEIAQTKLAEAIFGDKATDKNYQSLLKYHLDSLRNAGLITTESVGYRKAYAKFKASDTPPAGPPPELPHRNLLLEHMYGVLFPQGTVSTPIPFTREHMYNALIATHPMYRDADVSGLYRRISHVLNHLINNRYLVKVGLSKAEKKKIHVSADSKALFADYIALVEKFREGEKAFLDDGIQIAKDIVGDPESGNPGDPHLLSKLLAKAKANSKHRGENRGKKEKRVEVTPEQEPQEQLPS